LKAKALSVKNIPTFTWLDTIAKVPTLETYLQDAGTKNQLLQIVVYDLPNRDCHAKASNGELLIDQNGVSRYKTEYIDAIVALIKKYPQTKVVAVIEPDSLANLVTNLSDQNCQRAQQAYLDCTNYAIKALAAVGVTMYLDAGHAGWLGWPANLTPAAQMYAQVFRDAGSPPQLRGLATNVANYNALRASSPDPVTPPNQNYDEIHYIDQLAPALQSQGFPAHFIVDQGRSGVQNIRDEWGNWCNIEGAGFGTRPTTSTGSDLIDAIVWVKPGGESDGTSNTSAARYDSTCGLNDAKKPAPEAGAWFQDYFVDLVRNANPPL
jgi:cellulose 1,4-beta-cellobiosidase